MSLYPDHQVRQYLLNRYAAAIKSRGLSADQIRDDFDLLQQGIVDSLGIMELVADVETHFGHPVDFEDLDAEQITIVGPLTAHIQRKLAEAEALKTPANGKLDSLPRHLLKVKGHPVECWLAEDPEARRRGLMGVEARQLEPLPDGTERGMLFMFPSEQPVVLWMFQNPAPLDILYLGANGQVIETQTAEPMQSRTTYPSRKPAQYALELKSGLVRQWDIRTGDAVALPGKLSAH